MDRVWIICLLAAPVIVGLLSWGISVSLLLSKQRLQHGRALEELEGRVARQRAELEQLTEQLRDRERTYRHSAIQLRDSERLRAELDSQMENVKQQAIAAIHAAKIQRDELERRVRALARWEANVDGEAELKRMREEALRIGAIASSDARVLLSGAEYRASQLTESARQAAAQVERQASEALAAAVSRAESLVADRIAEADQELEEVRAIGKEARAQSARIVDAAEVTAKSIAGEAWDVRTRVQELRQAESAIKNTIDGYGTRYLVPSYSLMDEVADELAGADPVAKYRIARERSREIAQGGEAAACAIEDQARREAACRFVLDAFNGKADAILSRARKVDIGTLRQQLLDAFGLVNLHGAVFGEARITRPYLDARLEEVKWACVLQDFRVRAREEQRRNREQMREDAARERERQQNQREADEADARAREIERAIAKQREAFEAEKALFSRETQESYLRKIAEMQAELDATRQSAERKKSLAQQTRSGHVYVIANVGAFGEGVFKIGMTRRGDDHWRERIDELSDASVPFEYNIYGVIKAEDAPALERRLHWHLALYQVNKTNHRKEFFRVSLDNLRAELDRLRIEVQWSLASELAPSEFLETQEIEQRIRTDAAERAAWLRDQKRRFSQHASEQPSWATSFSEDAFAGDREDGSA